MSTIFTAQRHYILIGTILAMAAIILAVALTATGPTQAQDSDPLPCGPGALDVPADPDATISRGHYGVFDGYWRIDKETLQLNLCPPAVEHTLEKRTDPVTFLETEVEVSHRFASNIDIQQTVIHINGSDFEHTLTAADVEQYDFFKVGDANNDGVDDAVDQTVWWLKVDDESTPNVDEDSALAMGFSAALFHPYDWYLDDGAGSAKGLKPLQYEFEVIREPGIPVDEQGHVFAFDDSAPASAAIPKTAYWDSSEVDANALPLYPGEYHHFQWAFTKPGTYKISVQLKGHVRTEDDPPPAGAPAGWEPISESSTVTSEVREYVFQIGSLTLNKEPGFVVERSVQENSDHGTLVGDPIPVYQGDGDDLDFNLTGPGYSLFDVVEDSDGNAQIKVAGHLHYEDRAEYILNLSVNDDKDHESNTGDDSADSNIWVRINVTDDPEEQLAIALTASRSDNMEAVASGSTQSVGTELIFTATVTGSPVPTSDLRYRWEEIDQGGGHSISEEAFSPSRTVTENRVATREYKMVVFWYENGNTQEVASNKIVINWQ